MSFGITASSYVAGGGAGGSQFAAEILADSPLLYWRLGESSGTVATDSSGNGRNGTYAGSPTYSQSGLPRGDTNSSVLFEEDTNDYVTLASSAWMNVGSMTLICAVVFSASGLRMLITRYHDPSNDRSWFLYTQNREFKFYVRGSGGGETIVSSGFTATPGEVYFVAAYASSGGTGIRIYDVNGLIASATGTGQDVNPSTRPFMVARSDDGALYQHESYIDEVAFFGSVLSTARLDVLATEFFAPRPWINRAAGVAARNGTPNHTFTFVPATSGSLLVAIVAGAVTHTAVSVGWTKQLSPVASEELAVFTKTATAGESSFEVLHNAANFPADYVIYEFPPGCSYHSGVSGINNAWPSLPGLPGTPVTVFYAGTHLETSQTPPAMVVEWYFSALEEYEHVEPNDGATHGIATHIAYKENFTGTTAPPPLLSTNYTANQLVVFAINTP